MQTWIMVLVAIAFIALFLAGFAVLVSRFYRKVDQGTALIINKLTKDPEISFTGGLVLPIIYRCEVMDISVKTIELDRRGKEGLICRDNIRADIKVNFFVRVSKTMEDVLKVAQAIGCARASDRATLEELFQAKFSEALKTVGKRLDFIDLYKERDKFKDQIIEVIGKDLNGYVLEDAAIDYLEQTPLGSLDKDNILDAQGIRKITQLTTEQNVMTNDLRQTERKAIKKQDVESDEAIMALDRQRAEAEAKQKREISTVKAREEAETMKVQAEENRKAQMAKIKAEEEVSVGNQAKERQVEVAKKNKERVVAVETERVEKDRMLEQILRERETELNRIAKEKEVEIQKREIADVIRGRIAVDKTVAQEEELIKDLRMVAEAKRQKEVVITHAEAAAQEALVKDIKAAEARELAAKHYAREQVTQAEAAVESADRNARAKIRLSEGVQAESAAQGLAEVRVKEADAVALEKRGLVEARVSFEKMQAGARGEEEQGMARARVELAHADAVAKMGLAEATVAREKLVAQAKGDEEQGLAHARVREAEAQAVEKMGLAEGQAIREKLTAEAAGLSEKAAAMKALDGVGKEHEEFRLKLNKEKEVELAQINIRKDIAHDQASVLKEAFSHAKFNIVGGDGAFFDRFVKAVSLGQSFDGLVDNSDSVKKLFANYLTGNGNLPADLMEALPGFSSRDLQNVTVSAFLARVMASSDPALKDKLKALMDKAKELGVGEAGRNSN